jgi:putative endonuclease
VAESVRASPTAKGREGEDIAVALLLREGYRVLERNARAGRFELDVIAMDGEVLCFVEVRRRKSIDDALLSVTRQKQADVTRAAKRWIGERRIQPRCRFDVVVVAGGDARLIRNAFEATT